MSTAMTEREQARQERIATRKAGEETLRHAQLKRFDREIRDILLCLVNEHGAQYRIQKDGQHIFIYSGVQGDRPIKVAASRSPKAQFEVMLPWVRKHFPNLDLRTGKTKLTVVESKPVVTMEPSLEEQAIHAKHRGGGGITETCPVCGFPPNAEPPSGQEWVKFVYTTGRPSEFFEVLKGVSPARLRCTYEGCTFTRTGVLTGVHLHENHHNGKQAETSRKGGAASQAKRRAEKSATQPVEQPIEEKPVPEGLASIDDPEPDGVEMVDTSDQTPPEQDGVRQALTLLAEGYGFVVMTAKERDDLGGADEIMRLTQEHADLSGQVVDLIEQVAAVTAERDEAKAKLHLIQEAMGL